MNSEREQHETSQTSKKILIVDDHPVVRQGLTQFINQEPGLVVCAEAGNAKQALEAVEKQHVDLAIVDMLLKNTTGIQVTKDLKSRCPGLRVLIFSMSDEPHYVKYAFQAGVQGYITKEDVADEIINAIRQPVWPCYGSTTPSTFGLLPSWDSSAWWRWQFLPGHCGCLNSCHSWSGFAGPGHV
jgi:CheY-like chemotaxis protein